MGNCLRTAASCPQRPFGPKLSFSLSASLSQPAVWLPAVKVTLPAAMDYTGEHSQAEYDIALEGRSEAQTGRDESSGTSGPHRDQPVR